MTERTTGRSEGTRTRTSQGGSVRSSAERTAGAGAERVRSERPEAGRSEGVRTRTAQTGSERPRSTQTASRQTGSIQNGSGQSKSRQTGNISARDRQTGTIRPVSGKKSSGGSSGGNRTRKMINLVIDLVILAFMCTVVGLTIYHFEKGKGADDINSGKSYLSQKAESVVKDVEAALKEESRKAEEAARKATETQTPEAGTPEQTQEGTESQTEAPSDQTESETETETETPTPEPSPTPIPKPEIDPQAGTIYAANVVTQKPNYIPWEVDAQASGAAYAQVLANPEYYKVIYDQSLFVGDSVITGVSGYGFIDEGHVLAEVGVSVDHFKTVRDQIIAYNPEYVIIRYGLNEIGTTQGDLDWFISVYRENIKILKASLPETKIIVCAITPVTDVAITAQPRMVYIDSYNNALRKMAIEEEVGYTDSANVFHEHLDLYGKDGMHIQKPMYSLWLADMVDRMGIS